MLCPRLRKGAGVAVVRLLACTIFHPIHSHCNSSPFCPLLSSPPSVMHASDIPSPHRPITPSPPSQILYTALFIPRLSSPPLFLTPYYLSQFPIRIHTLSLSTMFCDHFTGLADGISFSHLFFHSALCRSCLTTQFTNSSCLCSGLNLITVCCIVNLDTPPTWVAVATPVFTRDPPHCGACSRFGREVSFEDFTDVESLLGLRRVYRPSLRPLGEGFVGDDSRGEVLHSVYPRVTNAVGELFLLTP